MPNHDMIEILSKDNLSISILRLEVTACNGHDTLICRVIHMSTSHGGSVCNTLDMVEHDLGKLKIFARLHPRNQMDSTTQANFRHLKDEDFVRVIALSRKHIPLDISLIIKASKLCNAIHNAKPPLILECVDPIS